MAILLSVANGTLLSSPRGQGHRHHKAFQNIWKVTFACLQQLLNTISASSKDGTLSLLSSASKLGKCLKIKASVGSVSGQAWTALVQLHKFKVMENF